MKKTYWRDFIATPMYEENFLNFMKWIEETNKISPDLFIGLCNRRGANMGEMDLYTFLDGLADEEFEELIDERPTSDEYHDKRLRLLVQTAIAEITFEPPDFRITEYVTRCLLIWGERNNMLSEQELVNWADLSKSNWEDFKHQVLLNDVVYYIAYGELPPNEVSIEPEFKRGTGGKYEPDV